MRSVSRRKYFPSETWTRRCGSFRLPNEGSRFFRSAKYWRKKGHVKLFGKYALCARRPRRNQHCSYQTTKKSTEGHARIHYISAYLCLSTYIHMFTLDTDSLKTLGFNPPTPTLRLRPMTSRLYELFSSNSARLCSLLAQLKRVRKSRRVYLSTNRASARIWADLGDENRAQRKDAYTRAAE